MPENQKKTPCSKLPKRNPDSKPDSDTTPTSDGQIQRPEMTGNGREIEISELTFRQQAALPAIALARSLALAARDTSVAERTLAGTPPPRHESLGRLWHRATPHGSLRSVIPAKAGIQE